MFHVAAADSRGKRPEVFLSKPPSSRGPRRSGARSAPQGTSAKQAPAKREPAKTGPKRGARPDKPAPAREAAEKRGPTRAGATARPKRPERLTRDAAEKRGPVRPGATERPKRPERPTRDARKPRPPRDDRDSRAPREERASPSRLKRARLHREGRPAPETRATGQAPRKPEPVPEERIEAHIEGEPQRIAKLLARAGIASRREIERMIAEGRIAIDGAVIDTPATILTSLKGVTVDGRPVRAPSATRLFLFHKPTGVLTAANDPKGRPTIYDRMPKGLPRLVPVGRLDLNTEGLLLLTNDGEFKRQLELPASGVVRSYRARVFGDVAQADLEELIHGVEIEGMRYGPIDANLERRTGRNGWVEMKLAEGKNREVRRVLEHLELQVSRLIRTSYGPFTLGDLPVGAVHEVHRSDLAAFRKTLK